MCVTFLEPRICYNQIVGFCKVKNSLAVVIFISIPMSTVGCMAFFSSSDMTIQIAGDDEVIFRWRLCSLLVNQGSEGVLAFYIQAGFWCVSAKKVNFDFLCNEYNFPKAVVMSLQLRNEIDELG